MVYNSLYYTVVIAYNILNYLCFGQVLLIENESDVSQNNRAENSRNVDFYVAYEREDSSQSRYNKPDDTDAALIDLLNNLGLRSQTPFNSYIYKNNYGKQDKRHIKGNKIRLHRGDVILHNNIYSTKPKTNVDVQVGSGKKRSKKGKTKKPSKKGETNDRPSLGLDINPGVDDIVKIAADLYEKVLKLNEHGETKIDGINIHNRGKHQNTNHDDHDRDNEPNDDGAHDDGPHDDGPHDDGPYDDVAHDDGPHDDGPHDDGPHDDGPHDDGPHDDGPHDDGPHEPQPHDQKPHDQDDENNSSSESIETLIKKIREAMNNNKTTHREGGERKNKNTQANDDDNLMHKIDLGKGKDEIDLLFHEITVATSTMLDLVHNVGCAEIERSVKYIAAFAENKCMVS